MTNGFVESQGIKIHYLAQKSRNPKAASLLFVPGIMMPAWIWEQQLRYFSANYNVVAMDPRSHGDSELCSDGNYAYSMAIDIQTVADTLDLQRLVLVGWSLAVPQVINYAAHFGSKRLAGLVLVDGIAGIDSSVPFYRTIVDQWAQFQTDKVLYTDKFIRSIFQKPQTEAYFEKLKKTALRMPTNTAITLISNYILQDFRSLLPKIRIPVFIATVKGPRLNYMKTMQTLFPNSELEIFESAGHALFVDQPERFNQSLENFLKKLVQ